MEDNWNVENMEGNLNGSWHQSNYRLAGSKRSMWAGLNLGKGFVTSASLSLYSSICGLVAPLTSDRRKLFFPFLYSSFNFLDIFLSLCYKFAKEPEESFSVRLLHFQYLPFPFHMSPSKVDSRSFLIWFKLFTLSSATSRSSMDFAAFSLTCFFSLLSLSMTSSSFKFHHSSYKMYHDLCWPSLRNSFWLLFLIPSFNLAKLLFSRAVLGMTTFICAFLQKIEWIFDHCLYLHLHL